MWLLAREGLLGPDHNLSHGNNLDDEELAMVLDQGCSISATPLTEMLNNNRGPLLGRVARLGGLPSLGSDTDIYFNSSMLGVTRDAFLHEREADNAALDGRGEWPSREVHRTTTREALRWAITGGARALRLESRIGAIAPGRAADLILVGPGSPNVFPALQGGNPAHALVMYAEASDIDTVMVDGRILKRHGRLLFPETRLRALRERLLESRTRVMRAAGARAFVPSN